MVLILLGKYLDREWTGPRDTPVLVYERERVRSRGPCYDLLLFVGVPQTTYVLVHRSW